jgi:peptidoglycan hydrolase-like protein with peptidoglycan-binding domain
MGSATRSAIRAYQQDQQMVADGYPGTKLLEKLDIHARPEA